MSETASDASYYSRLPSKGQAKIAEFLKKWEAQQREADPNLTNDKLSTRRAQKQEELAKGMLDPDRKKKTKGRSGDSGRSENSSKSSPASSETGTVFFTLDPGDQEIVKGQVKKWASAKKKQGTKDDEIQSRLAEKEDYYAKKFLEKRAAKSTAAASPTSIIPTTDSAVTGGSDVAASNDTSTVLSTLDNKSRAWFKKKMDEWKTVTESSKGAEYVNDNKARKEGEYLKRLVDAKEKREAKKESSKAKAEDSGYESMEGQTSGDETSKQFSEAVSTQPPEAASTSPDVAATRKEHKARKEEERAGRRLDAEQRKVKEMRDKRKEKGKFERESSEAESVPASSTAPDSAAATVPDTSPYTEAMPKKKGLKKSEHPQSQTTGENDTTITTVPAPTTSTVSTTAPTSSTTPSSAGDTVISGALTDPFADTRVGREVQQVLKRWKKPAKSPLDWKAALWDADLTGTDAATTDLLNKRLLTDFSSMSMAPSTAYPTGGTLYDWVDKKVDVDTILFSIQAKNVTSILERPWEPTRSIGEFAGFDGARNRKRAGRRIEYINRILPDPPAAAMTSIAPTTAAVTSAPPTTDDAVSENTPPPKVELGELETVNSSAPDTAGQTDAAPVDIAIVAPVSITDTAPLPTSVSPLSKDHKETIQKVIMRYFQERFVPGLAFQVGKSTVPLPETEKTSSRGGHETKTSEGYGTRRSRNNKSQGRSSRWDRNSSKPDTQGNARDEATIGGIDMTRKSTDDMTRKRKSRSNSSTSGSTRPSTRAETEATV